MYASNVCFVASNVQHHFVTFVASASNVCFVASKGIKMLHLILKSYTDEGFGRNVYKNVFFLSLYIYFYYTLRLSL